MPRTSKWALVPFIRRYQRLLGVGLFLGILLVVFQVSGVSCAITFAIIRAPGGDALRSLDNRLAVRILRELDARPVVCVALLRLLFQTAPALNYALAMSGIKLRSYLIGTLIGLPIPIALYCIFFDALAMGLHVR